jgi:hypothetical protein
MKFSTCLICSFGSRLPSAAMMSMLLFFASSVSWSSA